MSTFSCYSLGVFATDKGMFGCFLVIINFVYEVEILLVLRTGNYLKLDYNYL